MVAAVNLGMTVHAVLPEQVLRGHAVGKSRGVVGETGVPGLGMTGLAQERPTQGEHAGVIGTMCVVTKSAFFSYRCVLPDEGSPLLSMALVTGLIECRPGKLMFAAAVVDAVAGTAVHLAFVNRMGERLEPRSALFGMAVVTDLCLAGRAQYGIPGSVARMTNRAGDVAVVMRTTLPCHARFTMTGQTLIVLQANRCFAIRTELDQSRAFLSATHSPGMCAPGSVACLALQLSIAKRALANNRVAVIVAKYRSGELILMTGQTGICPFATVRPVQKRRRFFLLRNADGCHRGQCQHPDQAASGYEAEVQHRSSSPEPAVVSGRLVKDKPADAMRFLHIGHCSGTMT